MALRESITADEALERVSSALGELTSGVALNFDQVDVTCSPSNLVQVATTLRDAPDLQCHFFTFLSGIDRSAFGDEPEPRLEVLVHLYSPEHVFHVNIHVHLDLAKPVCPSLTGTFRGAYWHERETHEMFGITFTGHPNLANLYLPEDFEGHPLLKSFKLPTRLVKEWPGAKDPDEAAAGGR